MKTSFVSLLIFALGLCVVSARLAAADATVLKISGNVQAVLPGQTQSVAVNVGDKLPPGTTITTGPGSEAFIEPFSGAVATIKPDTTMTIETLTVDATKRTSLLNLRSGSITSTIDPSKRSSTDYGVRTPKGVAAARGTVMSVSVLLNGIFISALADAVEFITSTGVRYVINAGFVSVTPAGGEPQAPMALSQATSVYPELKGIVESAFDSVASVVEGKLGGISTSSAAELLAMVTEIAVVVSPEKAGEFQARAAEATGGQGGGGGGQGGNGQDPGFPKSTVDPQQIVSESN